MNHIFVVNDINFEDVKLTADEITEMLINKNVWLFMNHYKKVNPHDKVIIYTAGPGRRCFVADFTIDDQIQTKQTDSLEKGEELLLTLFPFSCHIKNSSIWKEPISIVNLKEQLHFITDKTNYGLFFRQSIKTIDDEDFRYILSQKRL